MTAKKQSSSDQQPSAHEFRKIRLEKAEKLRQLDINPYPYNFDKTHDTLDLQEKYKDLPDGEVTKDSVHLAGRIMSIRNSGMFIDLMDYTGRIQVFSHKQDLSESQLEIVGLLDQGDMIGVTGYIRRTPRGELTVNATDVKVLSKSLATLPDNYKGLADVEMRYRKRYLDLIMNEDSRQTLRLRSQIIGAIRQYFLENDYLEVETPMLHPIPGGAAAKPFKTHHNTLDQDMYLRIAPELYLKMLVVGGLSERVFEINRCFRNEGISVKHNPEFTSIESYQAFADYSDMMTLTENVVEYVCKKVFGKTKLRFGDKEIEYKAPWARQSMTEAVKEKTGVDFLALKSDKEAIKAAKDLGIEVPKFAKWGHVVEEVFAEKVEGDLVQPIHITDFPREISPLAKVHRETPRLAERFESFVNGWEIANAFSELTDPIDQRARFEDQTKDRAAGDEEAMHVDETYLDALEHGLPPTGGWGLGIDRLIMLLTDSHSIRDVILFPTLRRKD